MSAKVPPIPTPPQISPYSILRSLGKHLSLIAVISLVGAVITFFVVRMIPPVYSAEALVLVESQRIPENYVAATVNANLEGRLNALRQQILSYSRLLDVIRKYDLYRQERAARLPMEEVVELMRTDLNIEVQRGAVPNRPAAFTVTYRGGNATTVAQVANLIASFFIDENLRTREVEAIGTSEFLNAQLAEAKKRLEEQEQQLSAFKLRYSGELPQQENALISSIAQAQTQLMGLQDSLNRIQQNKLMSQTSLDAAEAEQAMLQRLTNVAAVPATTSAPASALAPVMAMAVPQRESDRLQQQLDSVRTRYAESHPEVKRLVAAVARSREMEAGQQSPAPPPAAGTTAQTDTRPPQPAVQQLQPANARMIESVRAVNDRIATLRAQQTGWDRELANIEQDRQKLLRDVADMQARIGRLPLREQELARVMRDYESTRANYQSMLDKKMSADVAANMERRQKAERFVMLEMARKPEKPIKPKKVVFFGVGSLLCFAIGLATAVGIEAKKGSLLGEWELPPNVVILGRVPPIVTASHFHRRRWRPLVWMTIPVGLTACLVSIAVYTGWLTF
jgi:polysaccharide biosynthesis transport protein